MDCHKARVNSAMLADHEDQWVMLLGEVVDQNEQSVTIKASDGGEVNVSLSTLGLPWQCDTKFVEVTGKAAGGGVDAATYTLMGNEFDLGTYNEALALMKQFPTPFFQAPM